MWAPWWDGAGAWSQPRGCSSAGATRLHRLLRSWGKSRQLRNAAEISQLAFGAAAGGCISQKCSLLPVGVLGSRLVARV